jgi:hypothetical protein
MRLEAGGWREKKEKETERGRSRRTEEEGRACLATEN